MQTNTTAPDGRSGAKSTTEEIAALFHVEPQTPRAALCRQGHYMGLVPVKLPNGRLLWDTADAQRLASGEVA